MSSINDQSFEVTVTVTVNNFGPEVSKFDIEDIIENAFDTVPTQFEVITEDIDVIDLSDHD